MTLEDNNYNPASAGFFISIIFSESIMSHPELVSGSHVFWLEKLKYFQSNYYLFSISKSLNLNYAKFR